MELHPHFQQPELFEYVKRNNIVPIAYSPIGSPGRPERDRTPDDTVDITDPLIVSLAEKYGVHPAAICLKWAIKRGQIPIPFSTNRKNIRSNLDAVVSAQLSNKELNQISASDKKLPTDKGAKSSYGGIIRTGKTCGMSMERLPLDSSSQSPKPPERMGHFG